jgi:hypothetical protein
VAAAAASPGPLEAGTLPGIVQQQQQQAASAAAAGFAASKAWVAAAGVPAVLDSADQQAQQQAQFDAIAAAVSGFDSAASTAATAPAADSGAALNGLSSSSAPLAAPAAKNRAVDDRWANWQNVVAAIKSASSGPLVPSSNSVSAGVGDAELPSTSSDPVPQMQEVSCWAFALQLWSAVTQSFKTPLQMQAVDVPSCVH